MSLKYTSVSLSNLRLLIIRSYTVQLAILQCILREVSLPEFSSIVHRPTLQLLHGLCHVHLQLTLRRSLLMLAKGTQTLLITFLGVSELED